MELTIEAKKNTPGEGKLRDYNKYMREEGPNLEAVKKLKSDVEEFASSFAMPGVTPWFNFIIL